MARLFARRRLRPDSRTGTIKAVVKQKPYKNQEFHALPEPTGPSPYHVDLSDVLPAKEIATMIRSGSLTIHVVGDTGGVSNPVPQQLVADAMEKDYASAVGQPPSFLYILGDVIYYYGEAANYYPQFYEPYTHYPGPIFAIPGNHDGDLATPNPPNVTSLEAFVNNFCAASPHVTPDAGSVDRDAMTQPNVYWTLQTPLSTMIGLYSNVPEGGVIQQGQVNWLISELSAGAAELPLVVCVHHPSISADTAHGGSETMFDMLDSAFEEADRYPDIVMSGHVHNYQRFTRQVAGRDLPYIVAGGGGYFNLYKVQSNADGTPLEVPVAMAEPGITLENYCDDRHGYMLMTFTEGSITGEYYAVNESNQPNPGQPNRIDNFTVDIKKHRLTASKRRP